MNSNFDTAIKNEKCYSSSCDDEGLISEETKLLGISQHVISNSTCNIETDHSNDKDIFLKIESINGNSERIDKRDCFVLDKLLNSKCAENLDTSVTLSFKKEVDNSIEDFIDGCEFNDAGKEEDDNSCSSTCNLKIKPIQINKEGIDKADVHLKVVDESDFNSSFPYKSKISLCSKNADDGSVATKLLSSNILDQNTLSVNYFSSTSVSTNSSNIDSAHIIKNQPLIMSAKPLLSEITQTTAKVSIGNTTISVPLLKPVCTSKYVQDTTDMNKNQQKSKSSFQQTRKLFSQINSKNSTTLSVNRGQKINSPTIVSLSQLQIKPSNNAKIVQATVVSNKLHLHSSMDVSTQSAMITSPNRAKPNCAQKFFYPKQVSVYNNSLYHNQQTEEQSSQFKNKLSEFTELKKTVVQEKVSESEKQNRYNFSSSVIKDSHFHNSESLANSKYMDSISLAVKQKMQTNLRLESLSEAGSLGTQVASETSIITPLTSPLEMVVDKSFQKSEFSDGGSQLPTTSTSGATTSITAIYATSTAPVSDQIEATSTSNNCTLSQKSITSFLNIPRTISLMLSKSTASQTTPTIMPMIIGTQSTISKCIANEITKNHQFPKTITLKKTENLNTQRLKPTPIHVIPIGSSAHVNINHSSGLLDLQCWHSNLGITLKNKRNDNITENINTDSEKIHSLTHNTTLTNMGTFSAIAKNEQSADKKIERTQNSTIQSAMNEDISILSTGNYLSNAIQDLKLKSRSINNVESPSKIEDSQNILLKQLLKNSSQNSNLVMSTMTATSTSVSQNLSSRKIINVRAPSLGLVSSLEAQLARPVIPPVPASTELTLSSCVSAEPAEKQLGLNSNILDCKIKQPIKIISKETSFVSNPKICSSSHTNRTALDEVFPYVHQTSSIKVNTTHAFRTIDKVSVLRSSPSEEFVSSFKGLSKTENSDFGFVNLSEKKIASDEKIIFQPSEFAVGIDPKTFNMSKQNRFNSSLQDATNEKNNLQPNLNNNKSPGALPSSNELNITDRKNNLSGEEAKDCGSSNLINRSTYNGKCGDQLGQKLRLSSPNTVLENINSSHISSPFSMDSKIKKCDGPITNLSSNEILTSTSRKLQEIKSGGTAETKLKKKRKRELSNINSTREDATNLNEFLFSKKRVRKCLRTEEDYDIYMDNLVSQMKHMASLEVLEPNLGQNFAICNTQGSKETQKLVKSKELVNNFFNDQFNQEFKNLLDFYGEQPFGFLKNTLKNNLNMQNDFYDQEFVNNSCTNDEKKMYKLLNSMKCRNFDLSENILTKNCRSNSGVFHCKSWPLTSFPGLVVINNADRQIGRESPVIPFIKPIFVKCDKVYDTGPPANHSPNLTDMDVFASSSKMESDTRKYSMHGPNEEQGNLTVILTISSMEVVNVLKDLASLLNIAPISSYGLLKDVKSANVPPSKQDVCTYTKGQRSYHIQGILNGSIKLCRNCGSTKILLQIPLKNVNNHGQNLNNLRASSGYMYFCRKSCLSNYINKNMSLKSKESQFKELIHKNTPQKHFKDMSVILKKNGAKKCRFKYFKLNCLAPRPRSKKTYQEIDRNMLELDTKMSPSYISQTLRQHEENASDMIRLCVLCSKKGDDVWNGASRLLNIDVEKWVHLNCALWSHGVYETISGGLVNVEPALDFGKNQACCSCRQLGASIKCFRSRCDNFYHLLCAKQEQCMFYKNKFIHCQTHYSKSTKDNELLSLNVTRRVFVERDENQQVDFFMHLKDLRYLLRVGSVIFLNVGQLLPHQLKEFHTSNNIYPVGYKAVRFYWSMKIPNKRCRYLCTITENGSRPEFTVRVQDQNESSLELKDSSPSAVWRRILEPIVALKKQQNLVQVFSKFISGDDFFGLNEPSIVRILENLPGVETFNDYRFKFGRSPLLEVPLHLSGSARTEPQQRHVLGSKKPHTQRTSTSATQRLSNSMIVGEVACPYSKQFVHSKSSQYKKMNQEWRNNVYLARSKIQGLGLYAARDLEKHTMVIEYIGEVIRTEVSELREKQYEAKNRGIYMFRLDEDRIVDATLSGGLARYINHSCNPNCVTEVVDVERDLRIIIFAKRRINRGEELSYDYKFDIEDDANKLPCMCGAPNCRKRMN